MQKSIVYKNWCVGGTMTTYPWKWRWDNELLKNWKIKVFTPGGRNIQLYKGANNHPKITIFRAFKMAHICACVCKSFYFSFFCKLRLAPSFSWVYCYCATYTTVFKAKWKYVKFRNITTKKSTFVPERFGLSIR